MRHGRGLWLRENVDQVRLKPRASLEELLDEDEPLSRREFSGLGARFLQDLGYVHLGPPGGRPNGGFNES